MDDQIIDAPASESIEAPQEGSLEAEMNQVAPESSKQEPKEHSETVPLAALLAVKDEVRQLKRENKELQEATQRGSNSATSAATINATVDEMAAKYPDVNREFLYDMVVANTKAAQQEAENKFSAVQKQQEAREKQEIFKRVFEKKKNEVIANNPDLPSNIDWDAVEELVLLPKYRSMKFEDVVEKIYGNILQKGKSSSENDVRGGADREEGFVDFEKMSPEQTRKVMDDPKARQRYFDWLDTRPGR